MLDFKLNEFAWAIINFAILLFLLHKFVLPNFYKMVEDEQEKKEKVLADLESNNQQAAALANEYEAKLKGIQDEANKILAEARVEREELRKKELADLIAQKQSTLAGLKEEMAYEKKQMIKDLQENAADIILEATQKVLHKQLSPQEQERIAEEQLREFEMMVKV